MPIFGQIMHTLSIMDVSISSEEDFFSVAMTIPFVAGGDNRISLLIDTNQGMSKYPLYQGLWFPVRRERGRAQSGRACHSERRR